MDSNFRLHYFAGSGILRALDSSTTSCKFQESTGLCTELSFVVYNCDLRTNSI